MLKTLFALLAFVIIMAVKDLLTRHLFLQGTQLFQVVSGAGAVCLACCIATATVQGASMRPNHWGIQGIRLLINGLSWVLSTASLKYLNPSTVAVLSKANAPLLICLSPWLGVVYSMRQKYLALTALGVLAAFVIVWRPVGGSLLGYVIAGAAICSICLEYILLRHSTQSEPAFVVAGTPGLACFVFGVLGALVEGTSMMPDLPIQVVGVSALGFVMYGFYMLSINRYRILPLGISEYPSLIAGFVVVAAELAIYGKQPTLSYFIILTLLVVLIGAIANESNRQRTAINPVKEP